MDIIVLDKNVIIPIILLRHVWKSLALLDKCISARDILFVIIYREILNWFLMLKSNQIKKQFIFIININIALSHFRWI